MKLSTSNKEVRSAGFFTMTTTQKLRFSRPLSRIKNRTIAVAARMLVWSTAFTLLISGCTTYNNVNPSTPYAPTSTVQLGQQLLWAPAPTDPSTAKLPEAPRYAATDVHITTELLSEGKFCVLEDSTVWMIDEFDTLYAAHWLPQTEIAILETARDGYIFHQLIRLNDGESVSATYLGAVALRTYISGKFEGWQGNTVFSLYNGQRVKQVDYKISYYYAYNPMAVFVNIGVPGLYEMIVDGVQDKIGVYVLR